MNGRFKTGRALLGLEQKDDWYECRLAAPH